MTRIDKFMISPDEDIFLLGVNILQNKGYSDMRIRAFLKRVTYYTQKYEYMYVGDIVDTPPTESFIRTDYMGDNITSILNGVIGKLCEGRRIVSSQYNDDISWVKDLSDIENIFNDDEICTSITE